MWDRTGAVSLKKEEQRSTIHTCVGKIFKCHTQHYFLCGPKHNFLWNYMTQNRKGKTILLNWTHLWAYKSNWLLQTVREAYTVHYYKSCQTAKRILLKRSAAHLHFRNEKGLMQYYLRIERTTLEDSNKEKQYHGIWSSIYEVLLFKWSRKITQH